MMNLDAAGKPSRPDTATDFFQPSDADALQMSELHVRFDGRTYRYGQYCYDVLKDALAYARLDQGRSAQTGAPDDEASAWTPPMMPSESEQRQMDQLQVRFDGRHYHYQSYRYDRLADALDYARRHA
ncbi:hypothetical protein [Noviherbaspirillum aerium]|uniref:hypothetical protein n=1 Tax=Noviherbaspirillum aerium TaxID=2588497 RepID=UPI00124DC33C|nr:hypothetical protein [Noviherbaspirillum aerium]